MWGIHRSTVNSPHKGQWRGTLMFSLICARIKGWANKGDAGDLRRHLAYYDVILTHWGRDKMAAISQTTLSIALSWIKMLELRLNFHWSLFLRVQLTISSIGSDNAVQATSHYLNQWWLVYWRIYASLGLNELMQWGTHRGVLSNQKVALLVSPKFQKLAWWKWIRQEISK